MQGTDKQDCHVLTNLIHSIVATSGYTTRLAHTHIIYDTRDIWYIYIYTIWSIPKSKSHILDVFEPLGSTSNGTMNHTHHPWYGISPHWSSAKPLNHTHPKKGTEHTFTKSGKKNKQNEKVGLFNWVIKNNKEIHQKYHDQIPQQPF